MPILKFIEVNAAKVILAEAKPKNVTFGNSSGKLNIGIGVDFEKEFIEKLQDDPLSWQKLQDAASSAYKNFIAEAVAEVTKADKVVGKLVGDPTMQKAAVDVCAASLKMKASNLPKEVDANVKKAWEEIVKTNKDYSKYKWRAAVHVGLQIGGVAISAAGIGGAVATGGVSAVIGLYSLIKGCIGLVKDLGKLWLTAEKFRVAINGQVTKLVKAYNAKKSLTRNSSDSAGEVINAIFGTEFATIGKCRKDVKQYISKLDGVDVKSHEISRELGKAMSTLDKAMRDIKAVAKNNKELAATLPKLESQINDLIVKIVEKQEMINEGREWAKRMDEALELLEKGKPGWLKVFDKSLVLLDLGLSFNDLSGQADKVLEIAWGAAQAAEQLYDDISEAVA
ncbi:hypothetical protein [Azospirillum argentinense]|uniref:Uncharacterized protein n=1 Tax=Azospirillum brasilense TaxID=192 RepID=A0A4D8PTV9_AZOBR|nr:hypothetical protein [Azospirillum argentinense]QCO00821.1 hypothetical protein D3867_01310 [Azospirillum argentinense]